MKLSKDGFVIGDDVVCAHPRSDAFECKGTIVNIKLRESKYTSYYSYTIDYILKSGKVRPCSHPLGFFVRKMEYFDNFLKGKVL